MKSIKKQLLVFIMAILCLSVITTTVITYYQLKDEMDELFDENLRQVAQAIAIHDLTTRSNFALVTKNVQTSLKGEEEFLIQIWSGDKLFYSSLPALAFPHQAPGGVRTVRFNGQKWRYHGLRHGDNWLIQVSQPIPLRHTVIWEIYFSLLIPLLIQLPIVATLVWFVVRRGFVPLARISSSIERQDATNLSALADDDIPEEVSVMVRALNGLLNRLAQALKTQKQFTADAAHELRTPLTAVRLGLDVLKRTDTEAERAQSIETLYRAVDRCTRLAQQLLELARQDPDVPEEAPITVSLGEVVKGVVADIAPLAHKKNIDLSVKIESEMNVQGQKQALTTLVANLLGNAVLYTPEHGKVRVSTGQENGHAMLIVADNGPGIPLAERSRIFDRFYRILDERTSQVTGSGLGLAIVKAVAEGHKAKIDLISGLEGKGIGFKISFPDR